MSETEKYVTPTQLKSVVDKISAAGIIGGDPELVDLSVSGSTLTLTLPGGVAKSATLPSGGGAGETPTLTTADLSNLMGA